MTWRPLGPIRIQIEEVLGDGNVGRKGQLLLPKSTDRTKGEKVVTLSGGGSGGGGGGARHSLQLLIDLKAGKAGSLTVSINVSTWLTNHSSLPLRLFDASITSDFTPVAEAPHTQSTGTLLAFE